MILLDSNIFIIDRFFKRDAHYSVNRQFVAKLPNLDAGITIYNLLEMCGLASFNLSEIELARWFYHFDKLYNVRIIFPAALERAAEQYWSDWLGEMYRLFAGKMTFMDAALLAIAEEHAVSCLVTWNKKHFEGRTSIAVMTPEEVLS